MKIWTDENRKKIVNVLFYAALTIELLLMLVEKSEISFSYESYVFRVTFLLTLMATIVMKRHRKEWAVVLVLFALSAVAYELSGKNDLLRLTAFLACCRDIDLRKAMKYSFYVSVAGFVLIFLLSVTGVMGDMYLVADFGRNNAVEKRYAFGFGHPNTLFGCVYALLLMWLWLYGRTAGLWCYIPVSALCYIMVVLTRSRTGGLICGLTVFLALLCRIFKKLADYRWPYILGTIFAPVASVVLTIIAAWAAAKMYIDKNLDSYFWTIESKIGYRISNLYYGTEDRGGVLYRWKLFAGHGSDSFFDMGWARLFYWYGIIPTIIIILAVFAVVYVSMKKHDIWTMILVISLSVYTLMEATFVTRYLGRDFFLLIGGVYLGYFVRSIVLKKDLEEGETNA